MKGGSVHFSPLTQNLVDVQQGKYPNLLRDVSAALTVVVSSA